MALDRFIKFKKNPVPNLEDVQKVLEDYLGAILVEVSQDRNVLIGKLNGTGSNPFQRISERPQHVSEERWIEVHFGTDTLDVLTRQADECTNVLADGFAKLVARYWEAELG